MCSRLHEDQDRTDYLNFEDIQGPHEIKIQNQGSLDSLCLAAAGDDRGLECDILDDEVEIEVKLPV